MERRWIRKGMSNRESLRFGPSLSLRSLLMLLMVLRLDECFRSRFFRRSCLILLYTMVSCGHLSRTHRHRRPAVGSGSSQPLIFSLVPD